MRSGPIVLLTALLAITPVSATMAEDVLITGARSLTDASHFVWTITNNGNQPVTMFRAPYHRGRPTQLPDGWTARPPTGPIEGDYHPRATILEIATPTRGTGIQPGETVEFLVWDPHKRGTTTTQAVVIGLADGTERVFAGVRCPCEESYLRRNYPQVGLGVIFALFLLAQLLRRSRKSAAESAPTD